MFSYREILGQSWKITWHNKYLWFFGLFASLVGGWSDIELIYRGLTTTDPAGPGLSRIWELLKAGNPADIAAASSQAPGTFIILVLLFLVIIFAGVFLLWLIINSQAAIVSNVARIVAGKKHGFQMGVESGIKRFWPVLGLNLVLKISFICIFFLISLPMLAGARSGYVPAMQMFYIIAFLVFIPLALSISFIIKYAICFAVIKKTAFLESLRSAGSLFRKNWLVSLEMAFILFFISFLFGLAVLILFMVLTVPLLFLAAVSAQFAAYINYWLLVLAVLTVFLLILALTGSILSTFQISSWTGLYLELISRGGASRISRFFAKGSPARK